MPTLREKLNYLGTLGSGTDHSASAAEEMHSQKRLCSCFDTAEDVQFASVNQEIRTQEGGGDWAGDGMSLEPPPSQIWGREESEADPDSAGGE